MPRLLHSNSLFVRLELSLFFIFATVVPLAVASQETHKSVVVAGFTILVSPEVVRHVAEADAAMSEMKKQLEAIAEVVPREKLAVLRKVKIWLSWDGAGQGRGAAVFHPSADGLQEQGRDSGMTGGIEIPNVVSFVERSRGSRSWTLMPELARAYEAAVPHIRGLIEAAYKNAMERKLYDSLPDATGTWRRVDAATDHHEYFAELSKAYLGRNDVYPFSRWQLKELDAAGYALMQKVWQVKESEAQGDAPRRKALLIKKTGDTSWFVEEGKSRWVEVAGGKAVFQFQEANSTNRYVELFDRSRSMGLRLFDNHVTWRQGQQGKWNMLYDGVWVDVDDLPNRPHVGTPR